MAALAPRHTQLIASPRGRKALGNFVFALSDLIEPAALALSAHQPVAFHLLGLLAQLSNLLFGRLDGHPLLQLGRFVGADLGGQLMVS